MRHCICLAALVCASNVRAAILPLVSPGPPVSSEGYLEVTLDWVAPVDPVYARVIEHLDDHAIVNDKFWMPRVTSLLVSQYSGAVALNYPNNDAISLRFQPEIDAGLASVEVSFGDRVGNFRPVTVTGAAGYSRTYDANAIPEPSAGLLAVLACCLVRRVRHVTASL